MKDFSNYDFRGWATRNDIKCADGRTIRKDAFIANDGMTVPLVWNHQHGGVTNVLGHALLENNPKGVICYGYLNDTPEGQHAKTQLEHGDIKYLSIYANQLQQNGADVLHGMIREVSLVLAGANPGAVIDTVISHSEYSDEEAIITTGESIELKHSDDSGNKEGKNVADENTKTEETSEKEGKPEETSEKTIEEVFNTMNEEQKNCVYALVGAALEDQESDEDDEEEETVKHNVFDGSANEGTFLSHADEMDIVSLAKNVGSFQTALDIYADENNLAHDAIASGFYETGNNGTVYDLFPEYKEVRPGAPELITSDQGWIGTVLAKVHKSPISRIRTSTVDIRNIDALRARGYKKGKQKAQTGNFGLVRRTTDPQTVYVKSALHRDDIIDITDFDYVQYLYNIDKMQLNEELATAIMLGDGRPDESEYKISEEHIRPIWTDDELYTMHVDLDIEAARTKLQGTNTGGYFGDNYVYAEALIETVLYAREKFKGTGTPDMYITPHMLNVMLLSRDMNGRRIFSSKGELASALNVASIVTAEQFADKVRTDGQNKQHKLLCIIANLSDYSLGSTKGGEITHFTQFDIDFNQQKSLLETRCSGALTRVYSAIVVEEPVTGATGETGE